MPSTSLLLRSLCLYSYAVAVATATKPTTTTYLRLCLQAARWRKRCQLWTENVTQQTPHEHTVSINVFDAGILIYIVVVTIPGIVVAVVVVVVCRRWHRCWACGNSQRNSLPLSLCCVGIGVPVCRPPWDLRVFQFVGRAWVANLFSSCRDALWVYCVDCVTVGYKLSFIRNNNLKEQKLMLGFIVWRACSN